MEGLAQTTIPGIASLSEESHLAEQVKKKEPILVILGNPPYSGISSNASEREVPVKKGEMYTKEYRIETIRQNGRVSYEVKRMPAYAKSIGKVKQKTWIGELIESYKIIDGEWFGERKHWLQDDYVKFIRFAQWKIEQVGEGVVGFITNHAYLDNPTFRGMRQSLLNAFDEIHILDLHGNSLKKEKCPDGSDDKNVFDIQQGVAIVLLIKLPKREQRCRVLHSERWGQREAKYQFLQSSDFRETKSKELLPSSPFYFLLPKNDSGLANWNGYVAVTDVFPINVTGIVTARDAFVIDFEKAALRKRIEMFMDLNLDDDFVQASFQLSENYMWRVHEARRQLAKVPEWEERFAQILYRPFDIRHTYFHPSVIWRTRADVMRHMLQENLALICPRQHKEQSGAFVTKHLAGHKTVSAFDINNVFPVYLYPDTDKQDLFSSHSANRQPNIAPGLIAALKSAFGKPPTPEEIFYYIYAILYANAYRQKYAEFLKTDFPRVPFTTDSALFRKLAEAGKELVALHLLESRKLAKPIAKCEGEGKLQVVKITYDPKRKRVHINPGTWFTGVSPELFEYHVGGYQVAQKWLKDRKGRTLSSEEVSSYCKILTALSETIRIQQSLDPLFEEVEKNLVEVKL